MVRTVFTSILPLIVLGVITGCADSTSHETITVSVDRSKYILSTEPTGAIGVTEARQDSKHDDDIVLVGRIGGRENPWIDGRAAFMLIDASMSVVAEGEDAGETEVCLGDCCASLRAECTTLVKVIDENGKPLDVDARELFDAETDDLVVVQGKVQRDDEQSTFTIAADGVYIRE